ncbi:hypothetical protein AOLI_G00044910 [Acnodon oligacanthus]
MGRLGKTGPPGHRGLTGENGEKGEPGRMGKMGPAGERGEKGARGIDGPLGLKGKAGTTCDCGRYRKVVGQMDITISRLKNAVKFVKNVILGLKETEEKIYLLVKEARRYRDALMNCKLRGGTLAMPKTMDTNTLLTSYVSKAGLTHVFIGLQPAEAGEGYAYADGSPLRNSTVWGLEVPTEVSSNSCVQMGSNGAWSQQLNRKEMAEATNPDATSIPAPTISLPLGLDILRTYSGALISMEIVFGGLVWILVASSNVPVPLLQGWVMFVSVTMFVCSSTYLALFLLGFADKINTDWNFMDMMYHFIALLFYFAAFVLEAATTSAYAGQVGNTTCISRPSTNIITFLDFRQYSINVVATIFAFVVTVCYGCSMFMGFKRWRK